MCIWTVTLVRRGMSDSNANKIRWNKIGYCASQMRTQKLPVCGSEM